LNYRVSATIVLSLLLGPINAQIILTYENNAPRIGDVSILHMVDHNGIDPGDSGADVVWDFSDLEIIETSTVSYVDPSNTPFGSQFQDANLCAATSDDQYTYGNITHEYYENTGLAFITFLGLVRKYFSDPLKLIIYPFTYNSSFTDNFYAYYDTYNAIQKGNVVAAGDAFGTLKLPTGTIYNALRIKMVHHITDSIAGSSIVEHTVLTQYIWYKDFAKSPVMVISFSEAGNTTETTAYYADNELYINNFAQTLDFQTFPNPAEDQFNIILKIKRNSQVTIEIFDLSGKICLKYQENNIPPGEYTREINARDLGTGCFMLYLSVNGQIAARKIFVK